MLLEIKLLAFVKFLYPNSNLVFPKIIFTTNQQLRLFQILVFFSNLYFLFLNLFIRRSQTNVKGVSRAIN